MLNIFGLMLLLMHIYACLGCTLYGKIDLPYEGDGLTPYTNFQNWGNAMWLLFVTLSGNWVTAFHDVFWSCQNMEQDPVTGAYGSCPYRVSAVPYFFSFVIFGICLLCNLFVAILLERFDYASTMEGVYDDRNPFDTLFRLNVIRQFVFKIRNRMRLVRALKANKKIDTDGLEFHEINLIIQKELARQRENRANGIEETRGGPRRKTRCRGSRRTFRVRDWCRLGPSRCLRITSAKRNRGCSRRRHPGLASQGAGPRRRMKDHQNKRVMLVEHYDK